MYNLHSKLGFGKHIGMPIWVIAVHDPTYIDWCIQNIDDFAIDELEDLELLPIYHSFSDNNPDALNRMREKIASSPEMYKSNLPTPFLVSEYFAEKGYDFYLENFKPLMNKYYKYKEATLNVNNIKLENLRHQDLRDDSWDSSERYTFDDTINDAFEGDYSNYSNID
ncbi:hypothetical protein [Hymenobacter bucti]|uniref:DUF4365 domain-containing protein n=1 Tax=Hymenobacter bucti TaxID=1844114 RepID=A0ABW4QYA2_9BACT